MTSIHRVNQRTKNKRRRAREKKNQMHLNLSNPKKINHNKKRRLLVEDPLNSPRRLFFLASVLV